MKIAVGIPSYNESKTIREVACIVDRALAKSFRDDDVVIVNMDSASSDGTAEIFEATELVAPKVCIRHKERGKGRNVHSFMEYVASHDIDIACLVDADLLSLEPSWIPGLLAPVRECGATFVTPVYRRDRFEALTTNTFARPIVEGLYGVPIRQPIGGEFGFSGEFAKRLLEQTWPRAALGYGVDVFLTLNALQGSYRIVEAELGTKMHKPSLQNRRVIFCEVAAAAFVFLLRHDWRDFFFRGEFIPASSVARKAVSVEKNPPGLDVLNQLEIEAVEELGRLLRESDLPLEGVGKLLLRRYQQEGEMGGKEWVSAILQADEYLRSTSGDESDVEHVVRILFPLNVLRATTLMRRMVPLAEAEVSALFEEQVGCMRELARENGR